jgi:hypothetical protein
MTDKPQPDPQRYYCPHCGTENPALRFQYCKAGLGLIGDVQFFVVYCGAVCACPVCGGTGWLRRGDRGKIEPVSLPDEFSYQCGECGGTGRIECRKMLPIQVIQLTAPAIPLLHRV